jgi:hypothetical protein
MLNPDIHRASPAGPEGIAEVRDTIAAKSINHKEKQDVQSCNDRVE